VTPSPYVFSVAQVCNLRVSSEIVASGDGFCDTPGARVKRRFSTKFSKPSSRLTAVDLRAAKRRKRSKRRAPLIAASSPLYCTPELHILRQEGKGQSARTFGPFADCKIADTAPHGAAETKVAQTSKSAVSRISKSAGRPRFIAAADLEVGDTAGLETCATASPGASHRY